jgi:hypothetical protein
MIAGGTATCWFETGRKTLKESRSNTLSGNKVRVLSGWSILLHTFTFFQGTAGALTQLRGTEGFWVRPIVLAYVTYLWLRQSRLPRTHILIMLSSLQITPACNLPLKAVRAGGKMVIVNLQVCFFATSCPSWMTKQKTPWMEYCKLYNQKLLPSNCQQWCDCVLYVTVNQCWDFCSVESILCISWDLGCLVNFPELYAWDSRQLSYVCFWFFMDFGFSGAVYHCGSWIV